MFGFLLFLHLTGLSLWLGSGLTAVVMLPMLNQRPGSGELRALARKTLRVISTIAHPSALVVLISGVVMIVQMNIPAQSKPLWLQVMEKGGGMVILLAVILTGILGSRLKKRLNAENGQGTGAAAPARIGGYVAATAGFMTLTLAVMLIVSLKL
ncbi:hypothetical protein [Paenibacillus tyrfis]|uniref:Copper resistance protein D domain-containing protein n=1 Tax=Paenibacillus tyrfis TaxID=1501230 RepID=A0A081P332_9BACL|nr:hypothetical protein [Paenibacillus tyrfis]KEQ25105.1 hypothetical protein ET33_05295 [Paenibacillus tyrfis]